MGRVIVTEFCDPGAVESLAARHDVTYDPTLADHRDRLLRMVGETDGLIVRNRTMVDVEMVAAARPRLRVVGRLGVGLDNIDLAACEAAGVEVFTAPGANAIAVAEHVIGAFLSLARPAFRVTDRILAGEWPRTELVGTELADRRLGLVGLGATARQVAERALGLEMDVFAFDPFVTLPPPDITLVGMEGLFRMADAVSIHVPLTPETTRLVDAARLALLPPGALLVDTSRGGVVDHAAVVDALRHGRLGGAALDVFPEEPPADLTLYREVPNLILTPHVAGLTRESNVRVSRMVVNLVMDTLAD